MCTGSTVPGRCLPCPSIQPPLKPSDVCTAALSHAPQATAMARARPALRGPMPVLFALAALLLPAARAQTVETYVTDDVFPVNSEFGTMNIASVSDSGWVDADE